MGVFSQAGRRGPGTIYSVLLVACASVAAGIGAATVWADGAGSPYAAAVLADGPVAYWRLGEAAGPLEFSTTAGALGASAWTHLAVTYDGQTVRWYANGVLNTTSAATFATSTGTAALSLGRGDQFGAQSLDEVAFYDRALDAATVAAHVTAGR